MLAVYIIPPFIIPEALTFQNGLHDLGGGVALVPCLNLVVRICGAVLHSLTSHRARGV